MAASTAFRALTVILAGSAVATGGYAYWLRESSTRQLDQVTTAQRSCQEALGVCSDERDAAVQAHDALERTTAEELDASRAELAELRVQREEADRRLAALKQLTEKFRKMIDSGKLQVVIRHGRMIVKLPAGVLFASGSAELSKEGKDALREVAGVLRQVPDRRFMVAGHTDNVPVGPPSPFKNNMELSTSRALVVAEHLVASGMPATRLVAAGYSEHEPVRSNRTEDGRQENRRIEIVLMPNLSELPAELLDAGAPSNREARDAAAGG